MAWWYCECRWGSSLCIPWDANGPRTYMELHCCFPLPWWQPCPLTPLLWYAFWRATGCDSIQQATIICSSLCCVHLARVVFVLLRRPCVPRLEVLGQPLPRFCTVLGCPFATENLRSNNSPLSVMTSCAWSTISARFAGMDLFACGFTYLPVGSVAAAWQNQCHDDTSRSYQYVVPRSCQ